MLKSDFHIHTNADPEDGKYIKYSPKDLIKFAASKGFEVLALTHHNYVYYNKDIASFAKKHGILLIPGQEASIEGKHAVVLNYSGKVSTFNDLDKVREENGVVIAAHPFFHFSSLGKLLEENIDKFDAIEYSHFCTGLINFNRRAVKLAKKYNKPLVGTSDVHRLDQMNHTFTLIDSNKKIDSILEAIRKGNLKLKTKPLNMHTFFKIGLWSLNPHKV